MCMLRHEDVETAFLVTCGLETMRLFVCEKTSQKEKGDNDKVMIRRDSISAVAVSFFG